MAWKEPRHKTGPQDDAGIAPFRVRAGSRGRQAPCAAMNREALESALRRVIREELCKDTGGPYEKELL
jgi:hypothetical protein